jgi:acyl-CoA dehydrogenase
MSAAGLPGDARSGSPERRSESPGTSELRAILADVVTRLFTERVTPDLLTSAERGEWPASLWQAVEENGLTMPLLPEAKGGAGGTWADAHVIVNAAGRHAAPIPLAETIVAAWLLSEAGLEVPDGPMTIAPGRREDTLKLARAGSGWCVTGTAERVPWGASARHIVIAGSLAGRAIVGLVAGGQARAERDRNLALEPRDTLHFDGTAVLDARPASERVSAEAVRRHGALVRSAQMAGALEALLAQSVRYATERKQFGKPIGNFQAIQHQLALLAGHAAAAGMAAAAAFRAVDRAADATFDVAVAKVRAGEAAGLGASIAHQVHGAIGFTYEHTLHFLTRRLWSWRAEFGAEREWAMELGRSVSARGADALWPTLTAR